MEAPPTVPRDAVSGVQPAGPPDENHVDPPGRRERPCLVLRLYVAGGAPRSVRAIHNTRIACEQHLRVPYDLEVIDLFKQPWRASTAEIYAAPTLVKERPLPVQRFIGVFSDPLLLLERLDLSELTGQGGAR